MKYQFLYVLKISLLKIWKNCEERTAWKLSKYGVFCGSYFPLFRLNTAKYGPEKTPYLDIFRAATEVAVRRYSLKICSEKHFKSSSKTSAMRPFFKCSCRPRTETKLTKKRLCDRCFLLNFIAKLFGKAIQKLNICSHLLL